MEKFAPYFQFLVGSAFFLLVVLVREKNGLKSWSAGFVLLTFATSFLAGALACTSLSMVCFSFASDSALLVSQPVSFLPAITSAHITLGGLLNLVVCCVLLSRLAQYRIPNVIGSTRDMSLRSSIQAVPGNHIDPKGQLRAGMKIGDYELVTLAGTGTFADVWLVTKAGESYAAKIAKELSNAGETDPQKEAERWSSVAEHKNVVRVVEARNMELFDSDQTTPIRTYFVIITPYYSNGTLKDFITKNPSIQPDTAVRLVIQILEGLRHLHLEGLVHRDMKPSNILMDGNTLKIGDFGLSRFLEDTHSKKLGGSIPYMSPEALSGSREAHVDVWATGIILFQLIAGKMPDADKLKSVESLTCHDRVKYCLEMVFQADLDGRAKSADEFKRLLLPLLKIFGRDK